MYGRERGRKRELTFYDDDDDDDKPSENSNYNFLS